MDGDTLSDTAVAAMGQTVQTVGSGLTPTRRDSAHTGRCEGMVLCGVLFIANQSIGMAVGPLKASAHCCSFDGDLRS